RDGGQHALGRSREDRRRHSGRPPGPSGGDRARRDLFTRERLHDRPDPGDRRRPADLTDSNARRTSLVLMLKAPSRSKRRLAAARGDAAASEAARRLAACALEDLAAWPGPTWLAPADRTDLDWLGDAAARHRVVLQGE